MQGGAGRGHGGSIPPLPGASSVSLCGRYSPDSLGSVPPTVVEGAVHHDGCHTTAQVVANGRGEQGREQNEALKHRQALIHIQFSL